MGLEHPKSLQELQGIGYVIKKNDDGTYSLYDKKAKATETLVGKVKVEVKDNGSYEVIFDIPSNVEIETPLDRRTLDIKPTKNNTQLLSTLMQKIDQTGAAEDYTIAFHSFNRLAAAYGIVADIVDEKEMPTPSDRTIYINPLRGVQRLLSTIAEIKMTRTKSLEDEYPKQGNVEVLEELSLSETTGVSNAEFREAIEPIIVKNFNDFFYNPMGEVPSVEGEYGEINQSSNFYLEYDHKAKEARAGYDSVKAHTGFGDNYYCLYKLDAESNICPVLRQGDKPYMGYMRINTFESDRPAGPPKNRISERKVPDIHPLVEAEGKNRGPGSFAVS